MKTFLKLFTALILLLVCNQTIAQTQGKKQPVSVTYEPRFEFRNASGELRDTLMPAFMFKVWLRSASFPNYVHWKNQHFAVKKTQQQQQFGLFTDSATTFAAGDTIGYVFIAKPKKAGHFSLDYARTSLTLIANTTTAANTIFRLAPNGIALIATGTIKPLTEITLNTAGLSQLFPNDPTVKATTGFNFKQ